MTRQLLGLPPNERLFLGERLVESVDCFASPEIAEAWSAEVARRLDDYESGRVRSIPSAVVHAEVRRRMQS
ncbi:MAG: addiction module protein [Planctomycetaceae bacterium]